ncbi:hypothetical protein JCM9533A_83170 [Catenuloplanes niger JCM 9533]
MRVEAVRVGRRQVGTRPPADGVELAGVRAQVLVAGAGQDAPEADVRMPVVPADRPRDGQEDRRPLRAHASGNAAAPTAPAADPSGSTVEFPAPFRAVDKPHASLTDFDGTERALSHCV